MIIVLSIRIKILSTADAQRSTVQTDVPKFWAAIKCGNHVYDIPRVPMTKIIFDYGKKKQNET